MISCQGWRSPNGMAASRHHNDAGGRWVGTKRGEPSDCSVSPLEDEVGDILMRCYGNDPHWLTHCLTGIELLFTVQQTAELRQALRALVENILASL